MHKHDHPFPEWAHESKTEEALLHANSVAEVQEKAAWTTDRGPIMLYIEGILIALGPCKLLLQE